VGAKRLDGLRVVLVDDDADSLDTMCLVLTLHGADARGVRTAPQGFALVREFRPHVLVSDLSMPGEDGYSLIARVRALPAGEGGHVPAVALTAHAYAEDRDRALSAGFQSYLSKPVEPDRVVDAIARLATPSP
jgi:CheY-like chemotaxis protein